MESVLLKEIQGRLVARPSPDKPPTNPSYIRSTGKGGRTSRAERPESIIGDEAAK